MNATEFRSMLTLLADGWSHSEYKVVASRFAEKVFYCDPKYYTFRTRKDLLAFFEDDGGKPQYCKFHDSMFDEERQMGVAEFTYVGTFQYHGTVWIKLEDDMIVSWREYQHISAKNWDEFWQG